MKNGKILNLLHRTSVTLILLTAITAWAQDASSIPMAPGMQTQSTPSAWMPFDVKAYSKPATHFPNPIRPYTVRQIPEPNLANSSRIDGLIQDGKLYISINDAIALALENNLDIAIARYNLNIADTDIWRALAGSSIQGVNSGLVQNTPGIPAGGLAGGTASFASGVGASGGTGTGAGGSGQGGTSIAAGGAGAGTGGIVLSSFGAGPQPSSFDPTLTGIFHLERLNSICNSALCANSLNTTSGNFSYSQGFHWGGQMFVSYTNSRVTDNSIDILLSPALNATFQLMLTQHLLQGFGPAVNTRFIQIAKNNREISDVAFRYQVATTVDQIENMYWALVYCYEIVKVEKQQLAFAQEVLANSKMQVEIGTLAPIELVRAEATVANDQQYLTQALTNLDLAQLLMKNALSRSLVDPLLADAEVIPTSTLVMPAEEKAVPIQDLVSEAFEHRADLAESRMNLVNSRLNGKAVHNALLPTLDLSVFYGGAGLGGRQNPDYICFTTPQLCGLKKPPLPVSPISYGATLNQLIDSAAPDKGLELSLTIPIRNRTAQATQVRAELELRQAQLQFQQLENQIRIEVRNAQYSVQQNRASVTTAQTAVELARQTLEIEQKKYKIGASTLVMVLQDQTLLAQSQATLLSAKAAYDRAVVELDRATGLLLEHAGIVIRDAERGEVTHALRIPHVANRSADSESQQGQPSPRVQP